MSDEYKYELPNIREGIKLLMDNPNLIIRRYNEYRYSESEISVFDCNIQERILERNYHYYNVDITSNDKCWISGYDEENFYYVCNRILGIKNLMELNSVYILLNEDPNIQTCEFIIRIGKLKQFMKDVYWIYLRDIIDKDECLSKEEREWLHELVDRRDL